MILNIAPRWIHDSVIIGYSGSTPNVQERLYPDPYSQIGVFPAVGGYMAGTPNVLIRTEINHCSNETIVIARDVDYTINFNAFNGNSYTFKSQLNDGEPVRFSDSICDQPPKSLGTVFVTWDGSGAKFISDSALTVEQWPDQGQVYPSGVVIDANGNKYRVDEGLVGWMEDRNGNRTYTTMTGYGGGIASAQLQSVKDSLNREIQVSTISPQGAQTVTYNGSGGNNRTITVNYAQMSSCLRSDQSIKTVHQLFPYASAMPNYAINERVICSVDLPNGRSYHFYYNSYMKLAKVVLSYRRCN